MSAWAPGAWALGAWRGTAWQSAAPVTVPDVTGLTQAAATSVLEGAGFVVAIVTASSSVVPEGTVISQAPVGGSESSAGATVTLTVSSGEAGVDPLSPEVIARNPNVRVNFGERKKKAPPAPDIEPEEPTPALKPAAGMAPGLDLLPVVAKVLKKAEKSVAAPAAESAVAPTLVVEPVVLVAVEPGHTPAGMPELFAHLEGVLRELSDSRAAEIEAASALAGKERALLRGAIQNLQDEVAVLAKANATTGTALAAAQALNAKLADDLRARDLRDENRRRAEEIARRLLDN